MGLDHYSLLHVRWISYTPYTQANDRSSILTGLPAGSYGAGNDYMERLFHVQNLPFPNLTWATTSWNMGAAFWPLLFVPLTESSGRMPGYFIAYGFLIISLFPSAFAPNYATPVVTRFFGGGASSVSINIVGGSISDVWLGDKARSLPMSLFGFTSVIGIALGPFVGSAIQAIHKTDPWRWIFYIQIIYNMGLLPVFWLILRETRPDVILKHRAKRIPQRNRTSGVRRVRNRRDTRPREPESLVPAACTHAPDGARSGILHSLDRICLGDPVPLLQQRGADLQYQLRHEHSADGHGSTGHLSGRADRTGDQSPPGSYLPAHR